MMERERTETHGSTAGELEWLKTCVDDLFVGVEVHIQLADGRFDHNLCHADRTYIYDIGK